MTHILRYCSHLALLIIVSFSTWAQKPQQIDSLLEQGRYLNQTKGDLDGAVACAFEAIKLSEKIDYERGAALGTYAVAVILSDNGDFEKSILYIEKAKKYQNFLKYNPGALFNLQIVQATNNYELGLLSLASSFYQKAEQTARNIQDTSLRNYYLAILFIQSFIAFEAEDTLLARYHSAAELLSELEQATWSEGFKLLEVNYKQAELKGRLGELHLHRGHLDSARYYFQKVFAIGNNSNNEFLIAVSLASIGKVEELEGNYLKAIEHLDSFESLSRRRYIYRNLLQVYDCKRRIYSKMGLADMEKKYDNLYQSMGLQLESNKTAGRDKSVSLLVKEQEWIMSQERKKSLYVSVGSMVVILLLLTVIIVWMKYYRRQKERIEAQQKVIEKERKDAESSKALTVEVQQKLDEVNLSFQEMSLQNQELAQRIYIDLEDLLEMARKNSPHFWKKFQERYPHFLPKMLEVDPHFRPSELVLCAYIYLGFSSKEYATYTFKSYKTVETYRYNIRKRLQLNSNIDLKIWLQSFIESNYELKSLMCK